LLKVPGGPWPEVKRGRENSNYSWRKNKGHKMETGKCPEARGLEKKKERAANQPEKRLLKGVKRGRRHSKTVETMGNGSARLKKNNEVVRRVGTKIFVKKTTMGNQNQIRGKEKTLKKSKERGGKKRYHRTERGPGGQPKEKKKRLNNRIRNNKKSKKGANEMRFSEKRGVEKESGQKQGLVKKRKKQNPDCQHTITSEKRHTGTNPIERTEGQKNARGERHVGTKLGRQLKVNENFHVK